MNNTQQTTEMHFERHQQAIAKIAYLKAENSGFLPEFHEQDWAGAGTELFF